MKKDLKFRILPNGRNSSPRLLSPNYVSLSLQSSQIKPPLCKSPSHSFRKSSPPLRIRSPISRLSRMGSPVKHTKSQSKMLSAYEKIRSSRSIQNMVLPGFVRVNISDINKYLSIQNLSKTQTADTTVNDSNLARSRINSPGDMRRRVSIEKNEVLSCVFNQDADQDEVIISVGRIQLTRNNLCTFRLGQLIVDNAIDACLKCLKKKNLKVRRKGKAKESIYCLSTKFCKYLFQNNCNSVGKVKKNLLGYE